VLLTIYADNLRILEMLRPDRNPSLDIDDVTTRTDGLLGRYDVLEEVTYNDMLKKWRVPVEEMERELLEKAGIYDGPTLLSQEEIEESYPFLVGIRETE
jgi:hypothetical protein